MWIPFQKDPIQCPRLGHTKLKFQWKPMRRQHNFFFDPTEKKLFCFYRRYWTSGPHTKYLPAVCTCSSELASAEQNYLVVAFAVEQRLGHLIGKAWGLLFISQDSHSLAYMVWAEKVNITYTNIRKEKAVWIKKPLLCGHLSDYQQTKELCC